MAAVPELGVGVLRRPFNARAEAHLQLEPVAADSLPHLVRVDAPLAQLPKIRRLQQARMAGRPLGKDSPLTAGPYGRPPPRQGFAAYSRPVWQAAP